MLNGTTQGPRLAWSDFLTVFFRDFEQGEHILFIAQNGSGKTYTANALLLEMMKRGMWSVYLWTKPRDKTISNFIVKNRFKIVTKPPFNFKREPGKFAIKAEAKSLKDLRAAQEGLFANAMDATWMTGKLALVLDELRYLTQILGLQDAVSVLFLQARSSSITLIAGSQRPRWIPIEAMSESKHFFIGPLLDKKDRQRLAEVLPLSTILLTEHLLENEFVYANMSGMAVIVKAR